MNNPGPRRWWWRGVVVECYLLGMAIGLTWHSTASAYVAGIFIGTGIAVSILRRDVA